MKQNSKIIFSVVIPLHNKEPYIFRTVASILKQTHTQFELIIVNDASTDNSVDQVKKFSDPRIRLVHRKASGLSGCAARNYGISQARNDWIAMIDADDEWDVSHLAEISAMILRFPSAKLLTTSYIRRYGDSSKNEYILNQETTVLSAHAALKRYGQYDFLSCNSVVVDKKSILNAGGFPEHCRKGGDSDTWVRFFLQGKDIAVSSTPTSYYNIDHSETVTSGSILLPLGPVCVTCLKKIRETDDPSLKKLLTAIYNRKYFSQLHEKKLHGLFSFSDLGHFLSPNAATLFKILLLLQPLTTYQRMLMVLKSFRQLKSRF